MINKKKVIKIIIIVVIISVIAAISVKYFLFRNEFLYAGTLEATKVDLSAQVSSDIRSVDVQEGDHVEENQSLIELSW